MLVVLKLINYFMYPLFSGAIKRLFSLPKEQTLLFWLQLFSFILLIVDCWGCRVALDIQKNVLNWSCLFLFFNLYWIQQISIHACESLYCKWMANVDFVCLGGAWSGHATVFLSPLKIIYLLSKNECSFRMIENYILINYILLH